MRPETHGRKQEEKEMQEPGAPAGKDQGGSSMEEGTNNRKRGIGRKERSSGKEEGIIGFSHLYNKINRVCLTTPCNSLCVKEIFV